MAESNMENSTIELNSAENIAAIFKILSADNPEPRSELESVNDFTFLVAVVLSAQATDKGVNKATKALFAKVQTPEQMLELGEDGLKEYIKTIGLYNSKARNVIALSETLINEHSCQLPRDLKALEKLPGVGRKTANVILNCLYGMPTMAVDTHVYRVSRRMGLSAGNTPLKVEKDLLQVVPQEYLLHGHHWLILHGRYVCKAKKPNCEQCTVREYCPRNL